VLTLSYSIKKRYVTICTPFLYFSVVRRALNLDLDRLLQRHGRHCTLCRRPAPVRNSDATSILGVARTSTCVSFRPESRIIQRGLYLTEGIETDIEALRVVKECRVAPTLPSGRPFRVPLGRIYSCMIMLVTCATSFPEARPSSEQYQAVIEYLMMRFGPGVRLHGIWYWSGSRMTYLRLTSHIAMECFDLGFHTASGALPGRKCQHEHICLPKPSDCSHTWIHCSSPSCRYPLLQLIN
jgi:hypothetical protein